jgi:molybdopterin/thiamine biosynthesis adenylyltransferase
MFDPRRFERNLGFMSNEEQEKLYNSTVSIAGVGGDGGMLAIQLARLGVGGMRLADPEVFETENTNRQATCTVSNIGLNKAVAVANYVADINPTLNIKLYDEGITKDNVEEFTHGSDLIIDETEFTMHALGIMLAREARPNNLPVLTALNIGFGALTTTFHPQGKSLEKVLGFGEDEPIDEISEKEVPLSRWLPYLPSYADLSVFEKVAKGEKSAPSIAPGVTLAASIGATQAFLNLVGRKNNRPKPVYAPKALAVDSLSGDMKKVRFGTPSHTKHLVKVIANNILKRNPETSY